jgi:hypothetical protein
MAAQEREIELKTIATKVSLKPDCGEGEKEGNERAHIIASTKALESTTNLKVEKARQQSLR